MPDRGFINQGNEGENQHDNEAVFKAVGKTPVARPGNGPANGAEQRGRAQREAGAEPEK